MLRLKEYLIAQKKTKSVLKDVAKNAFVGITEKELAKNLQHKLEKAGAISFFHYPVVWFGSRTGLLKANKKTNPFPQERRLKAEEIFILDVAPIFKNGIVVDSSTTSSIQNSTFLQECAELKKELKENIPKWVSNEMNINDICTKSYDLMSTSGFKSCQKRYLFSAFGHRLFSSSPLTKKPFIGLSIGSAIKLFGKAALSKICPAVEYPFWNESGHCAKPPNIGIWSIEPHFAKDNLGFKWEEILVVNGKETSWLSEEKFI